MFLGSSASTSWTITGNYIGTNAAGTAAVGNTNAGIEVLDADDNLIANNLVSGNAFEGIRVGQSGDSADRNTVQGNIVGTDPTLTADLGNGGYGSGWGQRSTTWSPATS